MKKEDCKRKQKTTNKSILVTIRITPEKSQWINKESLSPTAIFDAACKQLGYKGR